MAPPRKKPKNVHEQDIMETKKLLAAVREFGHQGIKNTVDGDIHLYRSPSGKMYEVVQIWENKEVARFNVSKTELMSYLITLRVKRRALNRKGKQATT